MSAPVMDIYDFYRVIFSKLLPSSDHNKNDFREGLAANVSTRSLIEDWGDGDPRLARAPNITPANYKPWSFRFFTRLEIDDPKCHGPPFFRRLTDRQVGELALRAVNLKPEQERLHVAWPCDFTVEGMPIPIRENFGDAFTYVDPDPFCDILAKELRGILKGGPATLHYEEPFPLPKPTYSAGKRWTLKAQKQLGAWQKFYLDFAKRCHDSNDGPASMKAALNAYRGSRSYQVHWIRLLDDRTREDDDFIDKLCAEARKDRVEWLATRRNTRLVAASTAPPLNFPSTPASSSAASPITIVDPDSAVKVSTDAVAPVASMQLQESSLNYDLPSASSEEVQVSKRRQQLGEHDRQVPIVRVNENSAEFWTPQRATTPTSGLSGISPLESSPFKFNSSVPAAVQVVGTHQQMRVPDAASTDVQDDRTSPFETEAEKYQRLLFPMAHHAKCLRNRIQLSKQQAQMEDRNRQVPTVQVPDSHDNPKTGTKPSLSKEGLNGDGASLQDPSRTSGDELDTIEARSVLSDTRSSLANGPLSTTNEATLSPSHQPNLSSITRGNASSLKRIIDSSAAEHILAGEIPATPGSATKRSKIA